MTSYSHRARDTLVHSESLMMTDDDFSELEVGPGGSRVYRPRSQTNSMSQGLTSNSTYSMYGSHFGDSNFGNKDYAKSHFTNQNVRSHRDQYGRNYFDNQRVRNHRNEYTESHFDNRSVQYYRNEYAKSHFDSRSIRSHRDFSPESFRSLRLPSETITICKADIEDLIRVEVDRRLPQEVDRCLQHILQDQPRRQARMNRRYDLDAQHIDTDDEADRYTTYSTKSEYAMRYVKRSKREMRHPYARSERGESSTSHRRFNQSQMARSFSQHSLSSMKLQQQRQRPPSAMQEIDLRNLNCTVVIEDPPTDGDAVSTKSQVGKENVTEKSILNRKGEILKKDHVFVKPSTIRCPKKPPPTFNAPEPPPPKVNIPPMIPSKCANQTKRLSDLSEMPEISENSSNDSMRPSFIKRKLFTQTFDVALEKENEKEDSHSESPLRNIYSSVPRPKNKHGKPVASQNTVKRNLFESVCMRELIEQIVPQEKMNATTGILKKHTQRSSIHETKSNVIKNKAASDINLKLPTTQLCKPRESDYDSDIIGEALLESTLQRPIMNDNDYQKNTTNMKNTVQQKESKSKPNNNTSEKKIEHKCCKNVENPKIAKKIGNVNSPKQLTQKCNNKESHPENFAKNSSSKDLSIKKINAINCVPDEPQIPTQLSKSEQFRDFVDSMKEKKVTSNEGNKPKNLSKCTTDTNREKETSKPIATNKVHSDHDPENQTVNKETLNSLHIRKRLASNDREQARYFANSMKEKKATSKECNKPKDLSKLSNAPNKEKEISRPIAINKLHNDLDSENQNCSTVNKKTLNSSRGNKRSASSQPNKPSKVMKTQTKPVTQLTSDMIKGKKPENKEDDLDSKKLHQDTPNNSFGELGTRRSERKSVRPSRFDEFLLNTSKELRRSISAGNAHKSLEVTKDNRGGRSGTDRAHSTSPTFTASDVDFSSPKKAVSNRLVAKCKDQEIKEPRRSPRLNVNSQKKRTSPVYKVTKQRISFGRKAQSPVVATSQHKARAVPEKTQSAKKPQDAALAFLLEEEDSAEDFTEQSLQRSHSFTDSQPKQNLNSSALTRSPSQSAERKTLSVRSPAYNVKNKNIAKALRISSGTRNSPRIANRAKVAEKQSTASNKLLEQTKMRGHKVLQSSEDEVVGVTKTADTSKQSRATASNKLLEQAKMRGNAFFQSSEDEGVGVTKTADTSKQSKATASNKLLEQAKMRGDEFFQSSEDEGVGVTKTADTSKHSRALNSNKPQRKSTPIRGKNNNSAISNSTNVKANVNRTSFKSPLPVTKAPARTNSQQKPRLPQSNHNANMSLRTTLTQSFFPKNRNKSQKLPQKVLELLGSSFAEDELQEEIDSDADSTNIRERVDQMKKRQRNKVVPSSSRSDLTTQSEMVHPSQSLKSRAARTFNITQNTSQYAHGGQGNGRPRHELGMTTLATGTNSEYGAMSSTRNATRFDDNASVVSFKSMKSFRSLSGKVYVPTLHF